jgi:hypothetical protein
VSEREGGDSRTLCFATSAARRRVLAAILARLLGEDNQLHRAGNLLARSDVLH